MTIVGEARYQQGVLELQPPLDLEEGARLLVARVEGALVLVPYTTDAARLEQVLSLIQDSIEAHRKTLESLAK
jgi:predicted DNA-binding antitoxin AbrB/MazE fold protein